MSPAHDDGVESVQSHPRASRWRGAAGFGLRHARRVVVTVLGGTLLLLGTLLLVLPGPGIPILLVGLAVLGAEFAWARAVLSRAREGAHKLRGELTRAVVATRERDRA